MEASSWLRTHPSCQPLPPAGSRIAFSRDTFRLHSLIYAEADVLQRYLEEVSRKLTENGSGFIHHSNIGDLPLVLWLLKLGAHLDFPRLNFVERQEQWRAHSMSAGLFRSFCKKAGLDCVRQELVNPVGTKFCIDCFSTFTVGNPESACECLTIRNSRLPRSTHRPHSWGSVLGEESSNGLSINVCIVWQ